MSTSPRLSIAARVTGREGDEPVGPGAHRRLLEPFVAHLLHVLRRDDPSRARRGRRVEREEVGPGLLELEADTMRVDDLYLSHPVLQHLGRHSAVTLEGELH